MRIGLLASAFGIGSTHSGHWPFGAFSYYINALKTNKKERKRIEKEYADAEAKYYEFKKNDDLFIKLGEIKFYNGTVAAEQFIQEHQVAFGDLGRVV